MILILNISTVENDSKTPVGNHRLTVNGESLFVTNFQDWDGMIGLIDPGNPEVSSPVPVDTG